MPFTKEEIAADLVWRYVEHVRETPDAETLSDSEIRQLVEVMLSVPATGEAVAAEATEERRAAVRERVHQVLAAGAPRPEPRRRAFAALPALVPAWRFRVVCAATAVLATAVATVGFWHHPPTRVVRVAFPRDVRDVEAMDETTAHVLLPRMLRNQLQPAEERNLMGHMLVCPGCFDEYISLKRQLVRLPRHTLAGNASGAPLGTRTAWLSSKSLPPSGMRR
jgi:hypothetical protein